MDWFLYDGNLPRENVKATLIFLSLPAFRLIWILVCWSGFFMEVLKSKATESELSKISNHKKDESQLLSNFSSSHFRKSYQTAFKKFSGILWSFEKVFECSTFFVPFVSVFRVYTEI